MELYAGLLDKGWKMQEIDDMDLFYYLRVLAHKACGQMGLRGVDQQGRAYIEDVWPI